MADDGTESRPAKRAKNVARACDPCRAGKRKCDGAQPCSVCRNGDKGAFHARSPPRPQVADPGRLPSGSLADLAPCSHAVCAYTLGDKRRRVSSNPLVAESPAAGPSSHAALPPSLPTPPQFNAPIFPPPPPIVSTPSSYTDRSPGIRGRTLPPMDFGPAPRSAADDKMLASLTRAMANEAAPGGIQNDIHDAAPPGAAEEAESASPSPSSSRPCEEEEQL